MDRSSVVYLLTETQTQNEYGIVETEVDKRQVYCQVNSVSRSEWYEGGRSGLNPELQITMFQYDYSNENMLMYNDVVYTIYRTYVRKTDEIELYVERRKGNEYTFES